MRLLERTKSVLTKYYGEERAKELLLEIKPYGFRGRVRKLSASQTRNLIADYYADFDEYQLTTKYNITEGTVYRILKDNNLPPVKTRAKGLKIIEAKKLAQVKNDITWVARKMGITYPTAKKYIGMTE